MKKHRPLFLHLLHIAWLHDCTIARLQVDAFLQSLLLICVALNPGAIVVKGSTAGRFRHKYHKYHKYHISHLPLLPKGQNGISFFFSGKTICW